MNGQDGTTSLAERTGQSAEPVPIRAPDFSSLTGAASLLEALPVGVYVCDVSGLIVGFNQKAAELWGRKPTLNDAADRYCGSWRLYSVGGERLAHAECPMADVLRTGQPVLDQEVVIERPDGSRITALVNIRALRDSTGAIIGAANCLLDITQRKRSEAALRENENRLSRELAASERLQEISALLIQEGDVDALYRRILDAAIALMHSDMASMQMLHHERGKLKLLAWKGFHPESAAFWEWVDLGSGSTCGAALSSGQRVVVPDIETSDLILGTPDFDAYRKSDVRAVQSTPLISRTGRLLGMISTHWRKPHQPAEGDLRLLDLLARQAADLLERARSEAAQRESEHRSRELIQALPAAIYTTDAAGRITYYNEAAAELWGCRPEVGTNKWCGSWRLYWPDGTPLPHDECPMARALKEGRPVRGVEAVAERPDGTRVPFRPYPTPLRDAAGTIVGAVNLLVDITDQKAAEKARAYLAAIVESSDDAIVSKNLDGIVTSWNRGAETLFGYRADEVVGRPIHLLFPPDRLREEDMILGRIRRGDRIANYETVRRCKDGREIEVSLTISPVRDSSGRIVGASKIARDISARKRGQAALMHSEQRYRGLTDAIAAVVWTTDSRGQVADMPQWRALTGQTFEEVRGFGWLDAIHPDDRALTREVWVRAVKLRTPCDTEYRVRMASGEYRWFNARGVPVMDDDGAVLEWVGVCIDITGRKRTEEKTKLLAREVNHRANNLLTIINAMMRQTRADTAAELMMAMQGRIGALARVQTRLARDQWERTDLLKLVGEELAPFGKDVSGRFQIAGPSVPLSAEAAQALAILVHELATNAVKHGALSLPAGRVAVSWALEGGTLGLSWRETGGPAVTAPTRQGFGTRAIALLAQQLRGEVALDWTGEGLACAVKIPVRSLEDGGAS